MIIYQTVWDNLHIIVKYHGTSTQRSEDIEAGAFGKSLLNLLLKNQIHLYSRKNNNDGPTN